MITGKKYIQIHISDVNVGDIIIDRNGIERTVCQKDIIDDKFMGRSIFGDTYLLGRRPVTKVIVQTNNLHIYQINNKPHYIKGCESPYEAVDFAYLKGWNITIKDIHEVRENEIIYDTDEFKIIEK